MSVRTKKVTLTDFRGGMTGVLDDRLLPLSFARVSYNFNNQDGALKDGVGLSKLKFPNGKYFEGNEVIEAVYYYKKYHKGFKDALLLYCSDKRVYHYDIFEGTVTPLELTFETKPVGVGYNYEGNDIYFLSTESEGLFVIDGTEVEKVQNLPTIKDMCIHNERLFITTAGSGTRLYFSDDFNPLNFSVSLEEGGYIDFQDGRGGLQKLVSSLGYLYIFRSYGISRLTAFANQTDFSVNHLFVSTGKIYPDSVSACANGILFLASDGLYKLTENGVSKILSSYDTFLNACDNSEAKGLYYNGKFYLKCKMLIDKKQEDMVLVYDLAKDSSYLCKNLKVKDFCAVQSENFSTAVVVRNNSKEICTFDNSGRILSQPLSKVWETPITDLGLSGRQKTVKRIEMYTSVEVKVTVCSDRETKTVRIKKGGTNGTNLSVRGKEFKFIFSTTSSGCEICSPTITVSYL